MDTNLVDPNNHVPEATPDDAWDDGDGLHPNFNAAATVLPPRRVLTENSPSGAEVSARGRDNKGLRIDSKTPRRGTDDAGSQQIEVQQIGGNIIRLDPETPLVARAQRHHAFHERPTRIEQKPSQVGEGHEWGHSRKHPVRWMLGAGLGVATVIIVTMLLLPTINKPNALRQGQDGPTMVQEEEIEGMKALNEMLVRQPEAEQLFRKFASSMIATEIHTIVRDAKRLEPLIREHFRPGLISKAWIPPDDTQWSVFDAGDVQYGILEGRLPNFMKFSAYLVFSESNLLLDWKATTCYGSATFSELEKKQGDPSEIRAAIAPAGFYTAVFPETEFSSYQFTSQDGNKSIWCYARLGSAAGDGLSKLFQTGEIIETSLAPQKVTLRLESGPEGALPNQWLIAEMLHKDWITPNKIK